MTLMGLMPPASILAQQTVDLPSQDSGLAVDAQEVFSVGSLTGDEWETFARVTAAAFDGEGNLYLLDVDNFRVVKVAPDGTHLADMGGEGGGPGEFGMPMALSVTKDGEVRVFDMGYGGFVVFNPDGSFKASVPLAPGTMLFPSGGLLSHPNGGVLSAGGGMMGLRRTPDGGMEFPTSRPVHLFSLDEEVQVDTLFEAWDPATADGTPELKTSGGGGIQIQAPPMRAFDPELMAGILPDGRIAVMDSTTYTVKVLSGDGEVRQLVRRPLFPREVTRRDRDAEKEKRVGEMEASGGPRIMMRTNDGTTSSIASSQAKAMMEARLESMLFAEEIPVVARMAVDWEGRIWLERNGPEVGERGPTDLIDSSWKYLGTVAPSGVRIPNAFGPDGLAAYIEEDELGVPTVVVRKFSIG